MCADGTRACSDRAVKMKAHENIQSASTLSSDVNSVTLYQYLLSKM